MALQQGRFTLRHDRALKVIYDFIVCHQPIGWVVCDLEGLRASDLPSETLSTSVCPDIAIVTPDSITLAEITIPWHSEDNLAQAKRRKSEKENYQLAFPDLTNLGLSAKLITIEIGCLGHHLPDILSALKSIVQSSTAAERTMLRDKLAQSVIASSHAIFWAHKKPSYMDLTRFSIYHMSVPHLPLSYMLYANCIFYPHYAYVKMWIVYSKA